MGKKIISVHVPKTAGTSFRHILFSAYGKDSVLEDYAEDPVNPCSIASMDPGAYLRSPILNLEGYDVVHGHFHPNKYSFIDNSAYITFLREPIDNVFSIFNFWKGLGKGHHALHDYFIDNKLSFFEFVELPSIRYLYTKCYFGSFDLDKFAFIGDYSHYKNEISRLSIILEKKLGGDVYLNKTSINIGDREKQDIVGDIDKRNRLASVLREDIQFYEHYRGR
jgi:hypothetical protein